jgi:hypothetical protein
LALRIDGNTNNGTSDGLGTLNVNNTSSKKELSMEIKNVIGDNSPEVFEKLQGGTLINVQVEEVVTEDEVVKYSYKQLFTTETNEEKLEKIKTSMLVMVYQDYLVDTDYKFYGDYEPKVGEDLELVRTKRSEARAFVRANREEV